MPQFPISTWYSSFWRNLFFHAFRLPAYCFNQINPIHQLASYLIKDYWNLSTYPCLAKLHYHSFVLIVHFWPRISWASDVTWSTHSCTSCILPNIIKHRIIALTSNSLNLVTLLNFWIDLISMSFALNSFKALSSSLFKFPISSVCLIVVSSIITIGCYWLSYLCVAWLF